MMVSTGKLKTDQKLEGLIKEQNFERKIIIQNNQPQGRGLFSGRGRG